MKEKFFYYKIMGRKNTGARKTTLATGVGETRPRLSVEGKLYRNLGWKNLSLKKVFYTPQRMRVR